MESFRFGWPVLDEGGYEKREKESYDLDDLRQ